MQFGQNLNDLIITGFEALFYLITLIFVIFSVSLAYHWFSYGTDKARSTTALVVYLAGSMPLFIILAGILISF